MERLCDLPVKSNGIGMHVQAAGPRTRARCHARYHLQAEATECARSPGQAGPSVLEELSLVWLELRRRGERSGGRWIGRRQHWREAAEGHGALLTS